MSLNMVLLGHNDACESTIPRISRPEESDRRVEWGVNKYHEGRMSGGNLFLSGLPSLTIFVDAVAQTLVHRGHISPKPPSAFVQDDISSLSPLLHANLIQVAFSDTDSCMYIQVGGA